MITVTTRAAHECVLAIVGSTTLEGNAEAIAAIKSAFDRHDPRLFVSGGAPGIDTMAERESDARACAKSIHKPEHRAWGAPHGFKWRNELVAQEAEHLVRVVDCQSKTYGSGWTMRRAEQLGKSVENIVIHTCQGIYECPSGQSNLREAATA